jgi:hypothetical protein
MGEHLPELEAQLLEFGRGIGDGAEHGSGCWLAPPRMPLQRGGNKPSPATSHQPPATSQGEHQQGGFSLSGALRRWAGDRRARQSTTPGALVRDELLASANWALVPFTQLLAASRHRNARSHHHLPTGEIPLELFDRAGRWAHWIWVVIAQSSTA